MSEQANANIQAARRMQRSTRTPQGEFRKVVEVNNDGSITNVVNGMGSKYLKTAKRNTEVLRKNESWARRNSESFLDRVLKREGNLPKRNFTIKDGSDIAKGSNKAAGYRSGPGGNVTSPGTFMDGSSVLKSQNYSDINN